MESEELPPLVETHDEILDKSAFELYKMYFDDDIEELFVRYSNLYARQKNDHDCSNTRIRYANLSQLPYLKTKIKF